MPEVSVLRLYIFANATREETRFVGDPRLEPAPQSATARRG